MKKSILKIAVVATAGVAAAAAAVAGVMVAKKHRAKASEVDQVAPPELAPQDQYERADKAEQLDHDAYAVVRELYDTGSDETPNANPVYSPAVETPRTADGKIDVTKLASPDDFCNWEEHGCQG